MAAMCCVSCWTSEQSAAVFSAPVRVEQICCSTIILHSEKHLDSFISKIWSNNMSVIIWHKEHVLLATERYRSLKSSCRCGFDQRWWRSLIWYLFPSCLLLTCSSSQVSRWSHSIFSMPTFCWANQRRTKDCRQITWSRKHHVSGWRQVDKQHPPLHKYSQHWLFSTN